MNDRADDERSAYCEGLEQQLAILEFEVGGVRDRVSGSTAAGRTAMEALLDRWPEALLVARRRLAELRLAGPEWRSDAGGLPELVADLKALLSAASTAA